MSGIVPSSISKAVEPVKELEHTKESLKEVQKNIESGKGVMIDTRELGEWKEGHVKDAILLPWIELHENPDKEKIRKAIPKDKIVYTYCKAGFRALAAGKVLKEHGYEVRPLKPGYEELVQAGFKSEK